MVVSQFHDVEGWIMSHKTRRWIDRQQTPNTEEDEMRNRLEEIRERVEKTAKGLIITSPPYFDEIPFLLSLLETARDNALEEAAVIVGDRAVKEVAQAIRDMKGQHS